MKSEFKKIAAVIRAWDNPLVEERVDSLLAMGIGKIIIICNATPDKGATKKLLGNNLNDPRVQLIEMFNNYSWSNALNAGLAAAKAAKCKFVFNISVEACFTEIHVKKMIDTILNDPLVAIVGTSFNGLLNGNIVELGSSYRQPRNTGMILNLEALGSSFSEFYSWCDGVGGMEDFDLLLRLSILTNLKYEYLDLRIPLIIDRNRDQTKKEIAERIAMEKIIARWRSFLAESAAERDRLEAAIAKTKI